MKEAKAGSIFLKFPNDMMNRLNYQANRLQTSRSSLIRQGVILLLETLESNEPEKRTPRNEANEN